MGSFPELRLRRTRRTPALRAMFTETRLAASDLIWPLFVGEGLSGPQPISSLTGQMLHDLPGLAKRIEPQVKQGLKAVLLFGKPAHKDPEATEADADDGVVQTAIRNLRRAYGDELVIMADVCMCAYTSHGHCGIVDGKDIDNDKTLGVLSAIALSYAEAGADWVCPSDMMDGRVAAIREILDEEGFGETAIMSYAVKYASAFYGPFREAVDSTPSFGDRRSYQMNPANRREAMLEAFQDEEEGADMLMVKPAGPYLDVLADLREATDLPLAAYQVSGEYASIRAAAEKGWLDYRASITESVLGIRRAGADLVVSYATPDLLAWLT